MLNKKRGVSEIIGYLLLVVFTVILAGIVFAWLRSYVPSEALNCPDGTSLFIKESSFDESNSQLKLVLKNNGRFDVAGFFIHATNSSAQETATIDLSNYSTDTQDIFGNSIVYVIGQNFMGPGETQISTFDIPVGIGTPSSISIIPVRYQTEDNRERFVSCSNAKTESNVGEPGVEIPEAQCSDGLDNDGDTCTDTGDNDCSSSLDTTESGSTCSTCTPTTEICNDGLDNDCDLSIDCLDSNCNADPSCVIPPECSDAVDNDGNGCSNFPADSGCTGATDTDEAGGLCTIGNGLCDTGETCAQEPTACEGQQAQCSSGNICISGSCQPMSGGIGCTNYCISLSTPYTTSTCVGPPGQCSSQYGGTLQPGGDQYCSPNKCCCIP